MRTPRQFGFAASACRRAARLRGIFGLGAAVLFAGVQPSGAIEDLGGAPRPAAVPGTSMHRTKEVALLQVEGWKHRVWSLYPLEKVRADEALAADAPRERLRVEAARAEYESFGVLLRPEVPLREVTVRCADLAGAGGRIAAAEIAIRRMAYIYVNEPSGTRMKAALPYETGTGEFPDVLLAGSGDARPQRNLQFLVTVHVPRETPPGLYHGELTVEFRREAWMPASVVDRHSIPFEVRVRAFALPELSPLLNTSVASTARMHEWLQRPDVIEDLHRSFRLHYQVPDPLSSPKVHVAADGSVTVNSEAWERDVAALFDQGGASHVFLPCWSFSRAGEMQGLYFLWHFPAVTRQRWFGALVCDERGELHSEFQTRFGVYLRHMHAVVKRRGWMGRVFIATMDEPYAYHTADRKLDTPENNYRVIRSFVRWVREQAPGIKTFATADPNPELEGWIDHWCLRNLNHSARARSRAERFGETVTFCDNYRTFVDYPAVAPRSLGWLAWKIGARGWLTFETVGSPPEAGEGPVFVYPQFGGSTVWGMGRLFYPDIAGRGGLAPSLRWELMRDGAEDYLYCHLLRERIRAVGPERVSESLLREARELLESASREVVGESADVETHGGILEPNAQSNLVPHRIRARLAELLERFPEGS